jgi:hypothetical protein
LKHPILHFGPALFGLSTRAVDLTLYPSKSVVKLFLAHGAKGGAPGGCKNGPIIVAFLLT